MGGKSLSREVLKRLPDFLAKINEGFDVVSGDRLYYGAEAMPPGA